MHSEFLVLHVHSHLTHACRSQILLDKFGTVDKQLYVELMCEFNRTGVYQFLKAKEGQGFYDPAEALTVCKVGNCECVDFVSKNIIN